MAVFAHYFCWLDEPAEFDALLLCMLILEYERGHFSVSTPVEHHNIFGTEPAGGVGGIDCRIARTYHDHSPAYRDGLGSLVVPDHAQCIDHPFEILTGDSKRLHSSEAGPDEDCVVLIGKLFE